MGSSRIADAQELLTLGCLGNAFAASAEESSKAFRKKVALLHITNSDLLAARNACFDVLDDAPSAYLVFMSASLAGQVSEGDFPPQLGGLDLTRACFDSFSQFAKVGPVSQL